MTKVTEVGNVIWVVTRERGNKSEYKKHRRLTKNQRNRMNDKTSYALMVLKVIGKYRFDGSVEGLQIIVS